jgi:hypothetical protein
MFRWAAHRRQGHKKRRKTFWRANFIKFKIISLSTRKVVKTVLLKSKTRRLGEHLQAPVKTTSRMSLHYRVSYKTSRRTGSSFHVADVRITATVCLSPPRCSVDVP